MDKQIYIYIMKKIVIIATFIWVGFICAISFMESWLKFQAPNITTEIGLGIGKLVFGALNIMELVFLAIITSSYIVLFKKRELQLSYAFLIIIIIVLLQTFWLLPTLDQRAELIIQNIQVQKSNLHLVYVLLEIIKTISLFYFGTNLLNIKTKLQ